MSRYSPVFPNCSICVSFGSYLGILYCFSNVFGYSSFILQGHPTYPIGFTSLFHLNSLFVLLALYLLFHYHLFDSFFNSLFFYYMFSFLYFSFSFHF